MYHLGVSQIEGFILSEAEGLNHLWGVKPRKIKRRCEAIAPLGCEAIKRILPDYGIPHYFEEKLIDELYNIKKFRDDYTHNLKGYILSSDLDLKGIDRIVDCFTKVSEDKINTVRKFVSELRSVLQT